MAVESYNSHNLYVDAKLIRMSDLHWTFNLTLLFRNDARWKI